MKQVFSLLILLTIFSAGKSQEIQHYYHNNGTPVENSTGFSGTGANIDVKYHKLSWRINPDSTVKYIKGFVQTNFVTIQSNVSQVTFDLNAVLTVDSVLFRGAKLPAGNITRSGNILSINLGTVLPVNTLDSLWIYYQGTPPSPSGAATGYARVVSPTAGNYITTLSESYEDRDWWPCKADMKDKIDSIDVIVNVPWASPAAADTFWAASNGVLVDSTISGNSRTFTYQSRYPIASYLVFVSVARFNRYYTGPVNINGTDVPVVYYLLAGKLASSYTNILTAMDKMNPVLTAFSSKFGDYPFKNEKHGYYDGLTGAGGMEHQTFSGIAPNALTSLRTLAHELCHQWFGDNVTFATWNDLWLAEGFARYSECLVAELVPSLALNAFNIRNSFKNSALSLSNTSLWIPDASIVSSQTIWSSNYGSAVYERGAMIVSMLRAICGDDKFYQALTAYQAGRAGNSANANDLKNYFNAVAGEDLTPFFNDYVGGSGNAATAVGGIGNPINNINWSNPGGNVLMVSVASQTRTAGSNVSYFRGPVVLHIKGAAPEADTTITFFDWGGGNLSYAGNGLSNPQGGNLLTYNLSFVPGTVAYDDSSRTLSTGTVTKITVVPVQVLSFTGKREAAGNAINLSIENNSVPEKVELLRSADGINFTLLNDMNRLPASQLKYFLNDTDPFSPVTYYKARITSNGREEYTNIIKVSSAPVSKLEIIPNPARQFVTIQFNNDRHERATVRILAMDGRRVKEFTTQDSMVSGNISFLPEGVYIVQQFSGEVLVSVGKLIVSR